MAKTAQVANFFAKKRPFALVRSFAISFVRRRARASRVDGMRTDVRLDGWIGGRRMMMMMMHDDDRALDEDDGDGETTRTKD